MAVNGSAPAVPSVPAPPSYPPRSPAQSAPANVNKKSRHFKPSVNPTLNINMQGGAAQPAAAAPGRGGGKGAPGGDFMSNEDIRAFSEFLRKNGRQRAVERVLDAEMLEARLRNIPDAMGSMAGSRARARRVTRHLKRIAQAEKLIAKYASALYSSFEREYEAELMKIGKGRMQQHPSPRFNWR